MSIKYKALVATRPGKPLDVLELKDVDPLDVNQNEKDGILRVKVLSAGLAFPDLLTIEDKHIRKMKYPFVAGREMAGIVTKVGKNCGDFKVGDMVFGACAGAIQHETRIPIANAYKVPAGVSSHLVSGFELNYGTTWHGLVDQGELKKGEWLLVLGASGGVGLAACDIGKALGARVIACASSDAKLKECLDAGAEFAVNYSNPDTFREQVEKIAGKSLSGGGIDVVYDAVGGVYSEMAIRMLKFGGRHVVIGFASGGNNPQSAIPKVPLNLALLNERKIVGVVYGTWREKYPEKNREIVEKMIKMIEEKKLKPLAKTYPIERWREAFSDIIERKTTGKVLISFENESNQHIKSKL